MDEQHASFIIHGVPVSVWCEDRETFERIRRHLGAYAADGPGPELDAGPDAGSGAGPGSGIAVELSRREVVYPVPLHAKRVLRYGRVREYFLDDISYFTDYFSTLAVSAGGLRIRGNVSGETLRELGFQFFVDLLFTLALFEALRSRGLYALHAAAVSDPDGETYLICGNASCGKTSLTLALIASGFSFVSDDTVFLELAGERDVRVYGFTRDFHVPEDLLGSFGLAAAADGPGYMVGGVRKRLASREHFQERRLASALNPGVLLFPELSQDGTRLGPLSMSETMARLLPQSLAVMLNPRTAANHLEALKRVVRHARGFRFQAGRDLKGNPESSRAAVLEAKARAGSLAGGLDGATVGGES